MPKLLTFRNLILVNLLVLILKIIYIIFLKSDFVGVEDFEIAQNLVAYKQYSLNISHGATAYKLPIYPLLICVFLFVFNNSGLVFLTIFQSFLSFCSSVLIYKILALLKMERLAVLSALLFILSPSYFLYSSIIESTNIFIPLFLCWIYCYTIIFVSDKATFMWISLLAFLTAVLFLTQVVIVPLVIVLVVFLFFSKNVSLGKMFVFCFVTLVFYSPWIVRNFIAFDRLIITKSPAWQNVYLGFTELGQADKTLVLIDKKRFDSTESLKKVYNEFEMETIYKNEVLTTTKLNPIVFVKKALFNSFYLWYVPPRYLEDNSFKTLFGRKFYVAAINLITILSLILVYRKSSHMFWFCILVFASFSLPYAIGHAANIRFKLDFEWFQLVLVAYAILNFVDWINTKKKRLILIKRFCRYYF